ncbi:hypothetical protein BKA57DRAFT_393347 [Linnemannia elongata]|nr:hypothetical protein BKA57DRAFT_393347 [Linnemannia elongata]
MPSGGTDSKPPPPTSTQSNASTSSTAANTNGEYLIPLSIKPQRLLDYFRQPKPPSLLLIDVRMQVQYRSAKIKTKSIVNVEPLALRDGVSAKVIAEQGLFNNPQEERQLFADRASFDLVIYYDQNSQEKEHSSTLTTLFRALHDLEFERPLSRRPVLLIGGFDAWLDCAGMDWVEGQDVDNAKSLHPSPTPSLDPTGLNGTHHFGTTSMATSPNQTYAILTKVARGGGISRTEGKAILANIEDYSFSSTAAAPPIPDKVPLPGSNMSAAIAGSNMMSGPSVPAPAPNMTNRPFVPPRPMRPLPQPPGMNDLKDYTKFGSGFSKIGGSQLGKAGLTNLGNTCYMNSVIQCLIATPPLTRFFMDGSFKRYINIANPLGSQGRLADAFCTLIRSMWSGQSLVSPTGFRNEISGFAPQFKGNEQHDSQEFLSFLLDGLHEDLKLTPRLLPPGADDEGSEADEARMEALPEIEASEIAWQRYLRRDSSIIVNIFQGQYKSRLCCSKCGKTSTTYNPFMYLTLPVKAKSSGRQPQTLTSCLNAFVEPELMEGDNAWNCPNCKKPRKATKQLTISRVPDVLLIQLKRFSSDGPFKNKIKAMVQYPIEDLDLTKYLPKRPASLGPIEPAIYNLYAVSNHSGEVSSGHYTACVRDTTSNSWTNFDDTRVSPCDKSVAVSEHGYTLFYVRRKHGDH